MNRTISLTIEHNPGYWGNPNWKAQFDQYGLEDAEFPPCPQMGKIVTWFQWYDMDLVLNILNHNPIHNTFFISGLLCWWDNGTEEVRIDETNYLDYLDDKEDWYLDYKCTYCVEE